MDAGRDEVLQLDVFLGDRSISGGSAGAAVTSGSALDHLDRAVRVVLEERFEVIPFGRQPCQVSVRSIQTEIGEPSEMLGTTSANSSCRSVANALRLALTRNAELKARNA